MDLAPLDDPAGGYRCQATFRDLATDEVFSAPKVVFMKGQEAVMESSIPGTHRTVRLVVQVREGGTATYELQVKERDRLIGRHRARVALDG